MITDNYIYCDHYCHTTRPLEAHGATVPSARARRTSLTRVLGSCKKIISFHLSYPCVRPCLLTYTRAIIHGNVRDDGSPLICLQLTPFLHPAVEWALWTV